MKYDGDIPSSLEELLLLPGIGPKMAHLVGLNYTTAFFFFFLHRYIASVALSFFSLCLCRS